MSQSNQEFHMLPYGRVVSAFDNEQVVESLKSALVAQGYSADAIDVHHGSEGEHFIDPDGAYHGRMARWTRTYQRLSGAESKMFEQAAAHLDAGHYIVSVLTDETPEQWRQVGELMQQHTQHSIFYCGEWNITILQWEQNL